MIQRWVIYFIVYSFGSLYFVYQSKFCFDRGFFIYLIHIQLFIIHMNSLYFSFLA